MKFIAKILGQHFRLYADDKGNVGLNTGATDDPLPWYQLGNWEAFKKDVDRVLTNQRVERLASFSLKDLEDEVNLRRVQSKSID